ncbi:choline-phosphate cytidylyltransferase [Cryptotrichosporon argae]
MAAPLATTKRHRTTRVEGRRGGRGDGSSRDASEEDNDTSDVGSILSYSAAIPANVAAPTFAANSSSSPRVPPPAALPLGSAAVLQHGLGGRRKKDLGDASASEGLESPTYDGDIESSSTIGTPIHPSHPSHVRQPSSPTIAVTPANRVPTPKASRVNLVDLSLDPPGPKATSSIPASSRLADPSTVSVLDPTFKSVPDVPVAPSHSLDAARHTAAASASPGGVKRSYERPVELTVEDIRSFVRRSIEGKGDVDGVHRDWRTHEPPVGRPVRIYADGVYDLFHFGHALQLRQAKLSFPSVHLLVGVCSDTLCAASKSAPSMTHAERCEAVRHCRWVDEVLPDAPWVVDQAWLDKYQIDYIAHDEDVYPSKDHEDVYAFAKSQGKFLPTRRTPAISTSDLLERIVRGYRVGFFDSKLEKNGHPDLLAADVDWDSDQSVARRERRIAAAKSRK